MVFLMLYRIILAVLNNSNKQPKWKLSKKQILIESALNITLG